MYKTGGPYFCRHIPLHRYPSLSETNVRLSNAHGFSLTSVRQARDKKELPRISWRQVGSLPISPASAGLKRLRILLLNHLWSPIPWDLANLFFFCSWYLISLWLSMKRISVDLWLSLFRRRKKDSGSCVTGKFDLSRREKNAKFGRTFSPLDTLDLFRCDCRGFC